MYNTCILTDSTAQLPHPTFTGQNRVKVIPLDSVINVPPTLETWLALFASIARNFDAIMVIGLSSALSPLVNSARQAAAQYGGRVPVSVIDSMNIGAGLGLLVQIAAEKAEEGYAPREIEQVVRAAMPHIYSVYCIQSPGGLAKSGVLSPAQSAASDILGIMPILAVEEGQFIPFQKVRTTRHLLESLQEFVGEYEMPRHIAFVKGRDSRLRMRPLRQFVDETFPQTPFTEHIMSNTMAALFGEDSVGLVVLDSHGK